MEKIENISKYQPRESKYAKLQKLLKKYIFLVPVLAVVIGIIAAAKIAGAAGVFQPSFEVDYKIEADISDVGDQKLKAIQDKMKKRQDEVIVPGRQIVAVDFGKPVVVEEKPAPDPTPASVPAKDSLPVADTLNTSPVIASSTNHPEAPGKPIIKKSYPKSNSGIIRKRKTVLKRDTVSPVAQESLTANAFNMIKAGSEEDKQYIPCYVNGDQDLVSGKYIKLRLGEETNINGRFFPKNTIFNGLVNVSNNIITVSITRIGTENIKYEVFDRDYNPGIIREDPKNTEIDQSVTMGVYQGANDYGQLLPLQAAQAIARAVVSKKRQKDAIVKINDGYPIFISKSEAK